LGWILLNYAFLCQPAVKRAHRSQGARHRSLAQSFVIKMREKAADNDMVNFSDVARANVPGKCIKIAGIRLDRMCRRIALPQMPQERISGELDSGTLGCA